MGRAESEKIFQEMDVSQLERFRRLGDHVSIFFMIVGILVSSGLAIAAAIDLALSQTAGKDVIKIYEKMKKYFKKSLTGSE